METKCTCERPDDNTCDYCEQQSSIQILEQAAEREYEVRKYNSDFPFEPQSFKLGAKWQQERSYSEEEVLEILCKSHNAENTSIKANMLNKWFENFKKK